MVWTAKLETMYDNDVCTKNQEILEHLPGRNGVFAVDQNGEPMHGPVRSISEAAPLAMMIMTVEMVDGHSFEMAMQDQRMLLLWRETSSMSSGARARVCPADNEVRLKWMLAQHFLHEAVQSRVSCAATSHRTFGFIHLAKSLFHLDQLMASGSGLKHLEKKFTSIPLILVHIITNVCSLCSLCWTTCCHAETDLGSQMG